jgi:NADPH:quinone reductase-like Zn-dependent oxidoreductase
MKAIVQNAYGSPDILELKEVDRPVMEENDVLVRVRAAALNAGDCFSVRGRPWLARFSVGFPKPKDYILGWDMAGHVEAIGEKVTRFQPGDAVFAACHGALAEYACAAEDEVAIKPANLTVEQAAAVPSAALTALQGLRDAGGIQSGQRVLINGASGGVGTFAVQIAKAFDTEVTGVCSTGKVDMVRALGADHVVDYVREDFTQREQRYDLILDNVASRPFSALRSVLAPQGRIFPNSGYGGMGYVFKALVLSWFMPQHASLFMANPNRDDLEVLTALIEAGKVTPVIDRTYPLRETTEGLRYLCKGHARGKVVITVET